MATLTVWNSETNTGTSMRVAKTSFSGTYLNSLHKGKTWDFTKNSLKCALTPAPDFWYESYDNFHYTPNISFTDNLGVLRKPVEHHSGIQFSNGKYRFFNVTSGKKILLEQDMTDLEFNANFANDTGWGSNSWPDSTMWHLYCHHYLLLTASDENWHDLSWKDDFGKTGGELDWKIHGPNGTGNIRIYEDPVQEGGKSFHGHARSWLYERHGWTSYHWSAWGNSGTGYRPVMEAYNKTEEYVNGSYYDKVIRTQDGGSYRSVVAVSYITSDGSMRTASDTAHSGGESDVSGTHYGYRTYGNKRLEVESLSFNYVLYFD